MGKIQPRIRAETSPHKGNNETPSTYFFVRHKGEK